MSSSQYDYALTLSSQFYFCGLPLRLDSYSRCTFNCLYCFANARGGNRGKQPIRQADVSSLARRFNRLDREPPQSVIDEFLRRRQPIHFGGMSDPFIPLELQRKVSLEILKVLADHRYPTVVSTKSDLLARDEYLAVLKRGNFLIQVSLSSTDDRLIATTDLGVPGPSRLLEMLRILSHEGIPTACRVQPILPTREKDVIGVIDECAAAGVRHIAVEHLKLPIETAWTGTQQLSKVLGVNLPKYYGEVGAKRVGREWILPSAEKLGRVLEFRSHCHKKGVTFGAADNDLLLLSDGACCCSGADFLPRFEGFFRHNYLEAVRRGLLKEYISFCDISETWCPQGSIAMYVNSNSRISSTNGVGGGIDKYLARNWNGSLNGNSPLMFYGVADSGMVDLDGFKLYQASREIKSLVFDN